MTPKREIQIWAFFLAGGLLGLWMLGNVLTPFIIGGVIAYLLAPAVDRLERAGLPRGLVTGGVILLAGGVIFLLFLVLTPLVAEQINALFLAIPEILAALEHFATKYLDRLDFLQKDDGYAIENITTFAPGFGKTVGLIGSNVISQATSLANFGVNLVISITVAIYLLYDWNVMVQRIDNLLPRSHAASIRALFGEINQTLAAFIRGQGTVCLLLGVFYAVALTLAGLNFGIAVGAIAGILVFIPYIGAAISGLLAVGLALFQFWGAWGPILLVIGIFIFGQLVEGNILTPQLVGRRVAVHPVWLLLALAVFGKVFGFVGVLAAVPLAAILGVLARRIAQHYQQGALYKGASENQTKE